MSEIAEIIDTLENRIIKLFGKIDALEENIKVLNQELTQTALVVQKTALEFQVVEVVAPKPPSPVVVPLTSQ